jgi:type VI secretion system protein VasG
LLPEISNQFLTQMLEGTPISKVEETAEGGEFVYELIHSFDLKGAHEVCGHSF